MNNLLIYCRSRKSEPIAEQTADILSEQLQQLGIQVEISHTLNLPRLLLNAYQTVHFIIEDLPLNLNESFYLGVCKALGKSTVLSVLNSESKINRHFLDYIKPEAFSVSQTNHLKLYRNFSRNKFILSAFPKIKDKAHAHAFQGESFLIPLQHALDEAFDYNIEMPVYFDGRKLLKSTGASQLRKKWNELINSGKLTDRHHLILSDNKVLQLLDEGLIFVVLADPKIQNTEFISWLNLSLNKKNVIVLNDFQATGFSTFWTSGQNSIVLSTQNWKSELGQIQLQPEKNRRLLTTCVTSSEIYEPTANELSRLYAKLWAQKTSLLTSRSVKL